MAEYVLTSPQGEKFKVTAPDGATSQEVKSFFDQQVAAKAFSSGQAPQEPQQKDFDSVRNFEAENPNLAGVKGAVEQLGVAAQNVPGSAFRYAKDVVEPILPWNLPETGKNLYNAATHPIDSAKVIGGSLKDRYGGIDEIRKTATEDPVGMLADESALMGGVGWLSKLAAAKNAGKIGNVLGKAGNALTEAATKTEPLNFATAAAHAPFKALPESTEVKMYEGAMKPSTTIKPAERYKRINTALDNEIPVTPSGLKKSKGMVNSLNSEIQDRITQYTKQGATVDAGGVASRAEDTMLNKVVGNEPLPDKALGQIDSVVSEFRNTSPGDISLSTAQKYKQSLNKQLDDFYKTVQYSPDKTAILAEKWTSKTKAALADELRGEISNIFPEVKTLNQKEASLIQLNKSLERAVNRIGNHELLSLKGVIGLASHPKVFFTNYLLNNPTVQSNLAVALRKARGYEPKGPGSGLRQTARAVGEYLPEEQEQQQ